MAQESGAGPLLGMAVVYLIPWTYDLRSTMVLKELFVADTARGRGVGEALMKHVARRATELDCPRLLWTVLRSNEPAVAFYRGLGATRDRIWHNWGLDEAGIRVLSEAP